MRKQGTWGISFLTRDFPGGPVFADPVAKYRGHGFDPWSGKIPRAMEQLTLCTRTTKPMLCHSRSHHSEKPPQEKPPQWEAHALQGRVDASLQPEKSLHSSEGPAQPQINRLINLKILNKVAVEVQSLI